MIKIKDPLKTTLRSTLSVNSESFADSINANYGMITSNIASEDLLHMVTTPPEVYLAEGGSTSVVNQMNVRSNRQENIEIINNLINRIIVSADAKLTYQDRVYITSVLNKLGIKDDRRFMEEVRKYYEDFKSVNNLIELYEQHGSELTNIIKEYKTSPASDEDGAPEVVNEGDEIHLHKDIFNRLFTRQYGDIIRNFNTSALNQSYITSTELALTDHTELSKNLYLNELRSTARDEDVPLIYRQENYYQDTALDITNEGDTNLERSLTSAVLLNIVERAYSARFGDINNRINASFDMRDSLYHSVDNLLTGFRTRVENFLEGNTYIRNEQRVDSRSYDTEITLLNEIISALPQEQIEDIYRINQQNIINRERYIENLRNITERIQRPVADTGDTAARTRREALMALENPRDMELKFREEGDAIYRHRERVENSYIEALPAESREIFTRVQEYLKAGRIADLGGSTQDNIGRLNADISYLSKVTEETRLNEIKDRIVSDSVREMVENTDIYNRVQEYMQTERSAEPEGGTGDDIGKLTADIQYLSNAVRETRVNEIKERVITDSAREIVERLSERENTVTSPLQKRYITDEKSFVDLIHRKVENTVDEELIQEIREQRRLITNKETSHENVINTTETTNTTVVNNNISKVEENNTNIEEIVRNSVRSQLGIITDRVYSRLERRLGNERTRRGF